MTGDGAVRRVVTGRDAADRSSFTSVGDVAATDLGGMRIVNLWGTGDAGARVGRDPTESPQLFPFFPAATGHGTRLVAVHFDPEVAGGAEPDAEPDAEAAARAAEEMARVQPGLAEAFEPTHPGMHTTDSVDYGICVSGEVWLELDDGVEERITPGTVVVQRGTRHAWRNRGDTTATMIYVLIAAARD